MLWRGVCVTGMLLGMLTTAAVEARKSSAVRVKRQTSSACEAKYADLTPQHIRCYEDHVNATQVVLDIDMKENILNIHNSYRQNVTPPASNMQKMIWDETLAETALKLAMQCSGDHSDNHDEPDYPGLQIGQNLGTGHDSWEILLYKFYIEKETLGYVHGSEYTDGVGHYFQMVYYDANRLGCAMASCPHMAWQRIRVCNYAVRMNADVPPYNKGTSCGDCPTSCDSSGKLCDCGGKLCYHLGKINPNTRQCTCQYQWTGDQCAENNCAVQDYFYSCRNGLLTYANCSHDGVVRDPNMCPHLCRICPACNGKQCQNSGTLNEDTCECACASGYIGENCESACSDNPCQNGGTQDSNTCECTCPDGFGGDHCETDCTSACEIGTGFVEAGVCACDCTGTNYWGSACENTCADQDYCSYFEMFDPAFDSYCEGAPFGKLCPTSCGLCQ